MPEIDTKFLFTVALEIEVSSLGEAPYGRRRIFHFNGGSLKGRDLRARYCPVAAAGRLSAATT